jgi:hypothetical protein
MGIPIVFMRPEANLGFLVLIYDAATGQKQGIKMGKLP